MGLRISIERNGPDSMIPAFDALAKACEQLGHTVEWWLRRQPLPPTDVLIWFGWCRTPEITAKVRHTSRQLFVEKGWFADRDECFQMDHIGVNGEASWAHDPLDYKPASHRLSLRLSGCLSIFLRFERDGKSLDNPSPYFPTNLDWLQHFSRVHIPMPVQVRPHFATIERDNRSVRRFAESMGWAWVPGGEQVPPLLPDAKVVAVVDSTVGSKALDLGLPVMCYGTPVYRKIGVVYCMTGSEFRTADVLDDLHNGRCRLDPNAIAAMVTKMRSKEWHARDAAKFPDRLRQFGL